MLQIYLIFLRPLGGLVLRKAFKLRGHSSHTGPPCGTRLHPFHTFYDIVGFNPPFSVYTLLHNFAFVNPTRKFGQAGYSTYSSSRPPWPLKGIVLLIYQWKNYFLPVRHQMIDPRIRYANESGFTHAYFLPSWILSFLLDFFWFVKLGLL